MTEPPVPVVDAHVHVWDVQRRSLPWLPEGHPLRRDFHLDERLRDEHPGTIDVVLVQADADAGENTDLFDLAATHPAVAGVVAWVDLLDRDAPKALDAARAGARARGAALVGVRCPPHDRHDPRALADNRLRRGVAAAAERGLCVDVLAGPAALPAIAELADAVPDARLVVDHLGGPRHTHGVTESWTRGMERIAAAPNVFVKASGVTAVAAHRRTRREYVEKALAVVGADRLMYGSDWPVCTLDPGHEHVIDLLRGVVPTHQLPKVLRSTARQVYRLADQT